MLDRYVEFNWIDANDESGDCENWLVVSADDDCVIAIVPKSEPCEDSDTGLAITEFSKAVTLGYCQLLAAAPDLLKACLAITESSIAPDCYAMDLVRTALAKALGEDS